MRLVSGLIVVVALAAACEKEPAIVVRFDSADQGSQPARKDLASPTRVDAAPIADAAMAADPAPAARTKPDGKPDAKADKCVSDGDCVLVADGCCGCANGGKLKAVLQRDEAKLTAAQKKQCAETMCTMMVSTDPSCGKRPTCVDGACSMRPARADEVRKLTPSKGDVQ